MMKMMKLTAFTIWCLGFEIPYLIFTAVNSLIRKNYYVGRIVRWERNSAMRRAQMFGKSDFAGLLSE